MQIGFIRREQLKIKKADKEELIKWYECYFRIAGVRPFSAKLSPNKNKTESKHPDYIIYQRGNVNKGDTFRDIPIGSLWMGEKVIDGELKKFMTGTIEVAFRKLSIAVWRAEKRFENEVIEYAYDIKTMEDKRQNSTYEPDSYENEESSYRYSEEIEDEIPF